MLEELADSIKRYGLFEAVKLQRCDCGKMAGEHYRVIDGHRRVRAVRMLRSYLQESECQIFDLDREKEIAMMVEMNLKRDSYTPVERYAALNLQRRYGFLKEAAKLMGLSYGHTRKFLSVMDRLDPAVKSRVMNKEDRRVVVQGNNRSGDSGLPITYRLAIQLAKVDHEAQRTLAYMVENGRLTPVQLREAVSRVVKGESLRDAINHAREANFAGTADSKVAAAFPAFLVTMAHQTMSTGWLAELGFEWHVATRSIAELRRAGLLGTEGWSFNYFSPSFLQMSRKYLGANATRVTSFARSVVDLLGMGEWEESRVESFLDKVRKEAVSQRTPVNKERASSLTAQRPN